jgi:hypothetical protein
VEAAKRREPIGRLLFLIDDFFSSSHEILKTIKAGTEFALTADAGLKQVEIERARRHHKEENR